MKILFVMKHRGIAGNMHAVADYMRISSSFGHEVALFGPAQPWLSGVTFSMDAGAFDKVVYLFESEIYRLPRLHEVRLLGAFARRDRMILDMDGMYNPVIELDDYDRNHDSAGQSETWATHYQALSDRIFKPQLPSGRDGGRSPALTFYGYDPALEMSPQDAPAKEFDIVYVGHNWWRWRQIEREIVPDLAPIRGEIGRIALIGLWWDAPPGEAEQGGSSLPYACDHAAIRRLGIETLPSVMYDQVIATMSRSRINIFTQRPVLHHLRHLTLKYSEIFYADTIPLLMLDPDHAAAVYGPAGRALTLTGRVGATLQDALRRPEHYRSLVHEVRRHLTRHHNYELRVGELVSALDG